MILEIGEQSLEREFTEQKLMVNNCETALDLRDYEANCDSFSFNKLIWQYL